MIEYRVKDAGMYNNINSIKSMKEGPWRSEVAEKNINVILTYPPTVLKNFKVYTCQVPLVTLIFRNNSKQITRQSTSFSPALYHQDKNTFASVLTGMGVTDQIEVQLTNPTDETLFMGIHQVALISEKSSDTPKKSDQKMNLSKGQEFRSERLEVPAKSPYAAANFFKDRKKEAKTTSFEPARSLKKEVENLNEIDRAIQESLKTAEMEKMRDTMEVENFQQLVIVNSNESPTYNIIDRNKQNPPSQPKPSSSQHLHPYPTLQLDPRQRSLLNSLTTHYKQLQQNREQQLQVKPQHRISNLIKPSVFNGQRFTTSGFEHPEKGEIQKMGRKLGLTFIDKVEDNMIVVARFANTDKTRQARERRDVKVVSREWMGDCYKVGAKLDPNDYLLK